MLFQLLSSALAGALLLGVVAEACEAPYPMTAGGRCPEHTDYQDIEQLVFDWIENSSCPDAHVAERESHWDYNMTIEDCDMFPRERNPFGLGSRLLRHAFHDAAGLMDGHVDLEFSGNDGLESSQFVLDTIYNDSNYELAAGGKIYEVLNKADFSGWAYIAAYRDACASQNRVSKGIEVTAESVGCDVRVMYGRWAYDTSDALTVAPLENFPEKDAHSGHVTIESYFLEHFNFDAEKAVTIMGAHTIGGARKIESGYTGMWTQSKNHFNNEYWTNMKNPEPIDCSFAKGANADAGPEACYYLTDDTLCEVDANDPNWTGRCHGWELNYIPNTNSNDDGFEVADKFQWRHSCSTPAEENMSLTPRQFFQGSDCTHIMMHVDMSMLKDIDAYICTLEEVELGERSCTKEGELQGWPDDSPCGLWEEGKRIFAKCYHDRDSVGLGMQAVELYNTDQDAFLVRFGQVYQELLEMRNPAGWPALQGPLEEAAAVPTLSNGDTCPEDCVNLYLFTADATNPWPCDTCSSGQCGHSVNGGGVNNYKCKPQSWTAEEISPVPAPSPAPSPAPVPAPVPTDCLTVTAGSIATGGDCPCQCYDWYEANYETADNPFVCTPCGNGYCAMTSRGAQVYRCVGPNWTPNTRRMVRGADA